MTRANWDDLRYVLAVVEEGSVSAAARVLGVNHATVLRRIAAVIRAHCRQDDLPVRYGGDEFMIVLSAADAERGLRVVERLKRAADALPWHDDTAGLKVTLSIGVTARLPGTTFAMAVAAADEALYAAKSAGRNRIHTSAKRAP